MFLILNVTLVLTSFIGTTFVLKIYISNNINKKEWIEKKSYFVNSEEVKFI